MSVENRFTNRRDFILIWLGQAISIIGSQITAFAFGVWVYEQTGSVTKFSIVILFTVLPGILLLPVIGMLVDRYDRRYLMILSNVWAALNTLAIAALSISGLLELWHVCWLAGATSISSTVLSSCYAASIALMVPKEHLGRASGMMQFADSAAQVIAPLLGGFLVLTIHIDAILLIDVGSYIFAISMMMIARIPNPAPIIQDEVVSQSLLRKAIYGWTYITARPGLFALIIFFAITNFTLSMGNILITPLVLSFANTAVYGTVASAGGAGLVVGSVIMSIWGGPRRRVYGVFGYGFLLSLTLILQGIRPNAVLIGIAIFISGCIIPVANACVTPILQSKTRPEIQGRVFAAVRLIAWGSVPASYLAAGSLADKAFEPLLVSDGPLADSIGKLIGVGPGRGIGLLLILMGIITLLATIKSVFHPRLLNVETEIPDQINDRASAATSGALQLNTQGEIDIATIKNNST